MQTAETPFRREENVTLRMIAKDQRFSKGWYVKVADGNEPFILPLQHYIAFFKSENHPDLDLKRTAFFNELETVVLLAQTGYTDRPLITLLNWTAALEYDGIERR